MGRDYVEYIIALSVFILFLVSLTTVNLIELVGFKMCFQWGCVSISLFNIDIFLKYFSCFYSHLLFDGAGGRYDFHRKFIYIRDILFQAKSLKPSQNKLVIQLP